MLKQAKQRQPPRRPHKPRSMQMGARHFVWHDGYRLDTQENANGDVWCDGDPWQKVEARFIRRAERA